MANIVILVKPGTTLERQHQLQKRYGVKCQVVTSFDLLKDKRDMYVEEWPLRRAMIDGASDPDLKQQLFFSSGPEIATHQLRNVKVKRNVMGNYAVVEADITPVKSAPVGQFGIRGSGEIINGVHVFNHIVSIDWVPEVKRG